MAKDKNKAGGDDDWDSWDDDTSWSDDLEEEQDDRKPSTRFAIGALKGAAKDLASVDRMKDLARKALPKGYGDAMDVVDNTISSTRELYHDAVRELKPGVRNSKRYLAELSKQYKDKIPSFGKKILDKWELEAKEEDEQAARDRQYQQDKADEKERELLATVTEALEGSQEQQAQHHADNQARDDIRQDVEDKRYAQTSKQMSVMQEGVSKMVGFNNQFAARYMRKSLELKYRALGLQRAQFEHSQHISEITLKLLQGIQKNTGLPDFVKANASERLKDMAFRKMFGETLDTLTPFNQRFFGNMKENIKNRVIGRVKGEVDNTQQLLSAMLAGRDMMNMTEGMGTEGDTREMQGEMAGGMLSSLVAPWLVGKGRDKLEKMAAKSPDSRLAKLLGDVKDNGANLTYGTRNIAKLIQLDLSEGHYRDDGGFLKDLARRGMNTLVDRDHGRRFSVSNMRPDDLIQGAQFDNLTYRSINEVIPGYLAKILQSTEGIRTGEDDPDSHVYDNSSGSFISNRNRVSQAKEQLFRRSEFSGFAGSMQNVIKLADPEEQLSPKARAAFAKQLMRDFDANIPYDPKRYVKLSNFDKSIDKEAAQEIAKFFRDRYGIVDDIDENGNRIQTIANKHQMMREREAVDLKFGEAGRYQPDIQRQLNLMANTGDREALRKIGILQTKDGVDRVNHDRYFAELDRYIDDPDYEKRARASTEVERAKSRTQSAGDTVINKNGGKDPKNTAAIRELTKSLSSIETLRNSGAAEWGYGKWWNDQGIIATGLEEQARAWQEIQLEAQNRAEEQRTEMLHLLKEISEQRGSILTEGQDEDGEHATRRRGILRRLAGNQRIKSALWKTGGWLKDRAVGTAKFAKNRFIADANRVIGAQRWVFDKLTGGARKLQDIYVKGENQPRLLAAKMKQGMYIDQESNKAIKSFSDIKGPVVDTDGNVVLTKEDFDKGLVNRWGKAVEQSGIRQWAAEGRDAIMRLTNIPGMAKNAVKGVWEYLDRVKDVYVKGETTPRLLALVMNNGGYFRKSDGKVIKHYTDIDGDVVDAQGNVVMTLADMQKGIVDKFGKPVKRAIDRVKDMAANLAKLPMTAMKKAKDLLVGAGKGVRNALGRMGNWWKDSAGIGIAANLSMADRLEKIYDLLNERLVNPNKKDYRDTDGDGVRDGSLEDLRRKREGKEGDGKDNTDGKKKDDGEKKQGMGSKLLEMLGNTKLGQMLKGLGGGALGQMLGGLGQGMGGLGMAALGATKLAGRGLLGLGKGALWAGRGALALGSMGMSAIGGLGGLGALLFNPITLGILAGGAAIWGAWKLYKHFADKPDPMQLLRLYAYGARGDESDFNAKILKTETYLTEHTISTGGGSYAFDPKTDASELLKVWEIDAKDRDRLSEWLRWFQDRFTPVYIRAFKNWKEQFPDGKKFMEMDKEPDGIAKVQWSEAFIDQDQNPQGPYYVEACPLAGEDRGKYLSGPNVLGLMQKQLEVIRKKYSRDRVKLTQEQASGRWEKMSAAQRKAHAPYALDGQKAVRRFNNMDYKSATSEQRRILDATAVVESISKRGKKTVTGGLIDELTSLRIRLYGLKVPLKSSIMVLLDLEDAVEPAVISEGDKTSFKGDLGKLYQEFAVKFGRAVNSPTDQKIWTAWMTNRFLPVFVELVAGANKYGAKGKLDDTLQMVKDDDRYLIAQAMAGATYTDEKGDKKSIWTWESCGFSGVEANTDSSSTLVQMDALKYLADKAKLREKTDKANQEKDNLNAEQQSALMQSAGYQKNADGTWSKKSKEAYGANATNTAYNRSAGVAAGSGQGGFYGAGQEVQSSGSYGQIDTGGVSDGGFRTPARGPGAEKGRKLLIKAAIAKGITDPKELAMLLANVEHESGDYKYSRELTYTKPEALYRVFQKYFPTLAAAQAAISQGPAAVFERVYGGRMGNDRPGDGAKYIGRGNIQITGKDNYLRIGKFMGKDLVANPQYLETPEGAAEGTVAWWMLNKRARDAAQSGDVDGTRKAVNGGLNGIQDVRQRTASWMMAIKNGQLQKLIDEAKGGGSTDSTTSANGDEDQQVSSPGDLTDVGYRAKVTATAKDVVDSAIKPADLGNNAPVATPTGMAPQPGKESTSQKQATSAGAPLASTPTVAATPSNPGANRGTAPTANATQVETIARQTQSVGQPDNGVKSVLEQQLTEQKAINVNTKKMADDMTALIAAVKGLNLGGGNSAPSQSNQQLQSRPQGVSPLRQRHQ